ncbi:MAG: cobalamin-dependent protein [Bacteroidota bacterium]|jgi:methanogenic corrinoid protein MtbC1
MQISSAIPLDEQRKYLEALLRGDKRACAEVVQAQLDRGTPVRTIYIDLFQAALYSVGQLWERNRISVATEHLATSITLSLFHLVYPILFSVPRRGRSAVVACTSNEFHFIGARMVADICELHGWEGHFVGANTPVADLCSMIRDMRPDVLAISLTLYANVANLLHIITSVQSAAPDIPIIVGGQGLMHGGEDVLNAYPGVVYHRTLNEFESYLDRS